MRHFYEAMLGPGHKPAATALREAQLAVARQERWQSPYYWAAFILQGEWR
jgi:CHAT domain-containing protein